MKILTHPNASFLPLVLLGVLCAFLALASAPAHALRLRGIQVQVINDTGRNVKFFYGGATYHSFAGAFGREGLAFSAYKVSDGKDVTLTPHQKGTTVHTRPDSHTLLIHWTCGIQSDGEIFHNPLVGYPVMYTGVKSLGDGFWDVNGSDLWFSVDKLREFHFYRVRRNADGSNYINFVMAVTPKACVG